MLGSFKCFNILEESWLGENLKRSTVKTWTSVVNGASVRSTLKSEKCAKVTTQILLAKDIDRGRGCHTVCYRLYTIVKRPKNSL